MEYQTFIKSIRNLPTPSPVLLHIESVVKNPDAAISDISDAIGLDPAIASKVIRLANSVYLGGNRTVSSLQNAIVYLGSKRVHSLVLASELLNSFNSKVNLPGIFILDKYWAHSVTTALIAEKIAYNLKRYEIVDKDEIFICALLHDIGKLIIAQLYPDAMLETFDTSNEKKLPYWKCEDKQLCHTAIGECFADHWSFPPILLEVIKRHHEPDTTTEEFAIVSSVVHIADIIAHSIGRVLFENETSPEINAFALEAVALSPEQFRVIAESAIDDEKKVDSLLELFKSP